jgi:hypothetical protein
MIKAISWILVIVVAGISLWVVFALWTGIYSVYSIPPSKDNPKGETLLVSRDQGEPVFNSPDYKPPDRQTEAKSGSLGFGGLDKKKRPLAMRTVATLPYIEWAYKKSLEPQDTE